MCTDDWLDRVLCVARSGGICFKPFNELGRAPKGSRCQTSDSHEDQRTSVVIKQTIQLIFDCYIIYYYLYHEKIEFLRLVINLTSKYLIKYICFVCCCVGFGMEINIGYAIVARAAKLIVTCIRRSNWRAPGDWCRVSGRPCLAARRRRRATRPKISILCYRQH